jgi:hypothetical protein|nr:hypothetical protein [Kofleriaceae bacterium]
MAHDVEWLARDLDFVDGDDDLGIQVVSTNIYARLLPGISNLTDRARYFSFYPWVLDTYARNCSSKSADGWRTWIRRHEFTLSAASIAAETAKKVSDDAAGGIIGARAARRILNKNKVATVDIDAATHVENGEVAKGAYFQHKEGGYGQYYKNPMTLLGLMQRDPKNKAPDRLLTNYAGQKLGTLIDQIAAFKDLAAIATAGQAVTLTDLIALGEKVHPGLIDPDSDEAQHLRGIVLGDNDDLCKGQEAAQRLQRRRTLALCLRYLQAGKTGWDDGVLGFRWGALEARHRDKSAWTVPPELETTRLAWALYVQNELMNYALECLLASLLVLIEDNVATPQEHAANLAATATDPSDSSRPIPATIDGALAAAAPPASADPWNPQSTFAMATALQKTKDASERAAGAFRILLRVGADRARFHGKPPFDYLDGGADIAKRDIHLQSWWNRLDGASGEASQTFLARLVLDWVVFRHLRVATRKLASQGDYTYRFRPEEGRLVACGGVDPGFTNPRLRQGIQMLADVGLIEHGLGAVTQHGLDFLAAVP